MNLRHQLKNLDVSKDVKWEGGLILFSPDDGRFYRISFGNGMNADDLCDGCDDYMYLEMDAYDDDGEYQRDIDGGQMDFARKNYTGYINEYRLIESCLDFLGCPDSRNCVIVKKLN